MYIGISLFDNRILASNNAVSLEDGISKCSSTEDITDQAIRAVFQHMHKEAEETGMYQISCELGSLTMRPATDASSGKNFENLDKANALAAVLNGRQCGFEVTDEIRKRAKDDGLVIVYGASDDLVEFDGAIYDEVSAYEGKIVYLSKDGIFDSCNEYDERCDECKMYKNAIDKCKTIRAVWCGDAGYCWTFETAIPHVRFGIFENDQKFCRGIVFHISELM